MKTKQEIKEWLLKNCVDKYGDLDLSGLDFRDFLGNNINISNWKVNGSVIIGNWKVKGNLFQDSQKVSGNLYQNNQSYKGTLFQDSQNEDIDLTGTFLEGFEEELVKRNLIQSNQKVEKTRKEVYNEN